MTALFELELFYLHETEIHHAQITLSVESPAKFISNLRIFSLILNEKTVERKWWVGERLKKRWIRLGLILI